jgi:hypothetical protein
MSASVEHQRDKRYLLTFLLFYGLILISWLFFMAFHFYAYFKDDSFVLSHYLLSGKTLNRFQLIGAGAWQLNAVDILVKVNMLIVAALVSTIFLIYNILPRMKNLNVWWMVLGATGAYLPSLLTIISFFQTGNTPYAGLFTINKFMTLIVLYPLNFAVFFYLYYILETFVFKKKTK